MHTAVPSLTARVSDVQWIAMMNETAMVVSNRFDNKISLFFCKIMKYLQEHNGYMNNSIFQIYIKQSQFKAR